MDGGALKRAREELGITRDQLYAYSGVSRETQRKMEELGYIPKHSTIAALERGLRLAAEEAGVMQRLKALEGLTRLRLGCSGMVWVAQGCRLSGGPQVKS